MPTSPPGRSDDSAYWASDADPLLHALGSSRGGLAASDAERRLRDQGPNRIRDFAQLTRIRVLLNQLGNPLLLVLVFAAIASAFTGEWIDASIVLVIVVSTVGIGYAREHGAQSAAAALAARVRTRARVLRDGRIETIPTTDVVSGDVGLLSAGSIVPADGVLLEATDFFVSEAALTGESFPVEKRPGAVLLYSTLLLIAVTFAIPYLPFVRIFGFVPLPAALVVTLAATTCLYVVAAEITKRWFYRNGR